MVLTFAQSVPSSKPSAQDALALRRVFRAVNVNSCPYVYNFHMHTVQSDGKLQPEAVMNQAIALGLQGLTITDHHTVNGYWQAQAYLDSLAQQHPEAKLPSIWTGIEITAELLQVEVHILGYAFDPDHVALRPYILGRSAMGDDFAATQVIHAIHQAGGIAVLAHPCRYKKLASELIPAAANLGIDGVEVYYAYTNPNPWHPSPTQTEEVLHLANVYNLLHTCGTDTHGRSLLQRL